MQRCYIFTKASTPSILVSNSYYYLKFHKYKKMYLHNTPYFPNPAPTSRTDEGFNAIITSEDF